MGAFFIYSRSGYVDDIALRLHFERKGFDKPIRREIGEWVLYAYKKQLLKLSDPYAASGKVECFGFGSFAYKGLGFRDSLKTLVTDFKNGSLIKERIVGNYCLIFIENNSRMVLINDNIGAFHFYTTENHGVISSSFSAILASCKSSFHINRNAVKENIMIGYIIPPATTVKEVFLISEKYKDELKGLRDIEFRRNIRVKDEFGATSQRTFVDEVAYQIDVLKNHFKGYAGVVSEFGGVDIGLSGGYDSRLLALLAKKSFENIIAHTHYHVKVTPDELCANAIAKYLGIPFFRCPWAKQPEEMSAEEFERNVEKISLYNDAQVFHDYSWLVSFRTKEYRMAVLGDRKVGMNGLAGELYRNHDNQLRSKESSVDWLLLRVITPQIARGMDRRTLKELIEQVLHEAAIFLGEKIEKEISSHQIRRWFGEVFSIYGAAKRVNIDGQLGFSFSPFLEYVPRRASYGILPHIGLSGEFESAMIKMIDEGASQLSSSYGYSFNGIPPLKNVIKSVLRGVVPYSLQIKKAYWSSRKCNYSAANRFDQIMSKHKIARLALDRVLDMNIGINREAVRNDWLFMCRTISVGLMLSSCEKYIKR